MASVAQAEPVYHSREEAREYFQRMIRSPYPLFATYDPNWLRAYWIFCNWWLDCAPDGANHLLAPMQGKSGIPNDSINDSENIGPGKFLRAARAKRGLDPICGLHPNGLPTDMGPGPSADPLD